MANEPRASRRSFILGVAGTGAAACHARTERSSTTASSEPGTPAAAPSVSTAAAAPHAESGDAGAGRSLGSVPKRKLGRTGVMVSMLGLGGSHIGQGSLDDDEAVALIRRAIDNGITFLDNCWDYNKGKSEERMGKALEGGYRQRVFLMTKLDGRTRDAARDQLGQSLARLKTDHIDLVQVHEVIRIEDPGRVFAENGAIHALMEARKEGKIRFIGFTGHKDPTIHLAMLEEAKKHNFTFDTVQMPLNVMDAQYHSFEKAVLPVLLERDIGVIGMKSMGSGDILKSDVVKPEECLRYSLSLPTSVVVSGIDSNDVLDKNLSIVRSFKKLEDAERTALLARVADKAKDGEYEPFKTSHKYDGTHKNPHWLEEARI
jgi:aryl-alcohol dehydrogenase-like predicted oxidoreductase